MNLKLWLLRFCIIMPIAMPINTQPKVATGTSQKVTIHSLNVNYRYIGKYTLTGYCGCARCCGKSNGITATGVRARAGRTIAVDPRKIPYGTIVRINGNDYVAEDCGGAIKGNRIDVFFGNHGQARAFGKQQAFVYVKEVKK